MSYLDIFSLNDFWGFVSFFIFIGLMIFLKRKFGESKLKLSGLIVFAIFLFGMFVSDGLITSDLIILTVCFVFALIISDSLNKFYFAFHPSEDENLIRMCVFMLVFYTIEINIISTSLWLTGSFIIQSCKINGIIDVLGCIPTDLFNIVNMLFNVSLNGIVNIIVTMPFLFQVVLFLSRHGEQITNAITNIFKSIVSVISGLIKLVI